MNTYIIVATFKPNTKMEEVNKVYQEELAQVAVLRNAGQLGAVHLSMTRGTVFLEINAQDDVQALAIVKSLPMSHWWNLEIYQTFEPTKPGVIIQMLRYRWKLLLNWLTGRKQVRQVTL